MLDKKLSLSGAKKIQVISLYQLYYINSQSSIVSQVIRLAVAISDCFWIGLSELGFFSRTLNLS